MAAVEGCSEELEFVDEFVEQAVEPVDRSPPGRRTGLGSSVAFDEQIDGAVLQM